MSQVTLVDHQTLAITDTSDVTLSLDAVQQLITACGVNYDGGVHDSKDNLGVVARLIGKPSDHIDFARLCTFKGYALKNFVEVSDVCRDIFEKCNAEREVSSNRRTQVGNTSFNGLRSAKNIVIAAQYLKASVEGKARMHAIGMGGAFTIGDFDVFKIAIFKGKVDTAINIRSKLTLADLKGDGFDETTLSPITRQIFDCFASEKSVVETNPDSIRDGDDLERSQALASAGAKKQNGHNKNPANVNDEKMKPQMYCIDEDDWVDATDKTDIFGKFAGTQQGTYQEVQKELNALGYTFAILGREIDGVTVTATVSQNRDGSNHCLVSGIEIDKFEYNYIGYIGTPRFLSNCTILLKMVSEDAGVSLTSKGLVVGKKLIKMEKTEIETAIGKTIL